MASCGCGVPGLYRAVQCPNDDCAGYFHLECYFRTILTGEILATRCQMCRETPGLNYVYQTMQFNVFNQKYMILTLINDYNAANNRATQVRRIGSGTKNNAETSGHSYNV